MNREVEIEIDALTESVLEVSTGKTFKTEVTEATIEFLNSIHKKMDGNSIGKRKKRK
jgi:hypothetical protein